MATADVQRSIPDSIVSPEHLPSLRSRTGNYVDAASTGWMHSIPSNMPWEDMRALYERQGYLWVKNVLPREAVLDMRERSAWNVQDDDMSQC